MAKQNHPKTKSNNVKKSKTGNSGNRNQNRSRNHSQSSSQNSGQKRSSNVTEYKRPFNFDIGMTILMIILVYLLYSIVRFMSVKHVVGYEVRKGSISENNVYEGIALRSEEVIKSEFAGHINYYTSEGDRLAGGKLAYTIDESGEINNQINADSVSGDMFSKQNYSELSGDIAAFSAAFTPARFNELYQFKSSLNSTIQKFSSSSILSDIESLGQSASVHYCKTPQTGYLVYETDGYEDKTFDTITSADFDSTNYTSTNLENNAMVSVGDPAYRLEEAEDWSVVIMIDGAETASQLEEMSPVKVRFLKNQYESWATITTRCDTDGTYYANLSFTNSMVTFCTDRFINLELLTEETSGLKVPKSSLIDDEFYVIPAAYVTDGNNGSHYVLHEIYDANGEKKSDRVTVTIYSADENEVYVDKDSLANGDILLKDNSNETFTVSKTGKLTGVYNINQGYADFRQVTVVRENEDYAIVKSDSVYGLREHDFIVLDAKTMTPDEFLYE